jgi:kumamolisin
VQESIMPGTGSIPEKVTRVGHGQDDEAIELSVYLKPRTPLETIPLPGDPADRRIRVRELRAAEHESDIAALRAFAQRNGLRVTAVEPGRRLVKITGTAAQFRTVFKVELGIYSDGHKRFRSHDGALHMPPEIAPFVEAVLGLDNRPFARPALAGGRKLAVQDNLSVLPNEMAVLYNFPAIVNGSGQCIAIIELGGGYYSSDITTAFNKMGLTAPSVNWYPVDGGANSPGGIAQ